MVVLEPTKFKTYVVMINLFIILKENEILSPLSSTY